MTLKLYEHPLSPYARKVKIVLYEKGIPFDRIFVNPTADPSSPDIEAWVASSPRLEVPTLVDGDVSVFDSTIILDYVEEKWPDPPSLPADPAERARIRMLEELCDTELEAVNWGIMELLFFRRAEGPLASEMMRVAGEQLNRLWHRLDRELDGRGWMGGSRFGLADAAVYPHVAGSAAWGFPLTDDVPRLQAWQEQCAGRESVQRDGEAMSAWIRENLGANPSSSPKPIVRQYRDYRLEWMMKSGGAEIVAKGLDNGTIKFANEHR